MLSTPKGFFDNLGQGEWIDVKDFWWNGTQIHRYGVGEININCFISYSPQRRIKLMLLLDLIYELINPALIGQNVAFRFDGIYDGAGESIDEISVLMKQGSNAIRNCEWNDEWDSYRIETIRFVVVPVSPA